MSHINTPKTIADTPSTAQPMLKEIEKAMGSVPNLFRIMANSPAVLEGYMNLSEALGKGTLDAATSERIALAISEINGCEYCLAAHTFLAKHKAKLSDEEINHNRRGGSTDTKAAAAVQFAVEITQQRGKISKGDINSVLAAGFTEAEVVEIIAQVARNTLSNYMNNVLATDIDFPKAKALS